MSATKTETTPAMEVVEELCSFEGRLAGTDAERRAANRMAERLRASGRQADVEPTYVHPQFALVHAAHCVLGIAGSLVAIALPALGFGVVLAAATSMYLDLDYRVYLVRRLFFRRASQNVVSPGERAELPARVVLTAHLDAAKTGAVYAPKRARRSAKLASRHSWFGPFRFLFWSLALLLPALGARMAGLDSEVISAIQLPPTLVLLIGVFALVDIELSDVVPGANDDASGVATALAVAADLDSDPLEHLDVWVVLPGAEECLQEGMRSFVRSHRKDLADKPTYFINLDTVGRGDVRFHGSGGWTVTYPADRRLFELAAAIADADDEGDRAYGAKPVALALAGDEMPPRIAGFPSIAISCADDDGYVPGYHLPSDTPANVDPAALGRAHSFALELVRQLDRDIGRRQVEQPSD
jgi:hypothetical protein